MKLNQFISLDNIAEELSEEELSKIGNKILAGFQEDLSSSQEWLNDVKKVEELASLISKKKNIPLPNSANIKFPLITKACYEFSSRTYPEIIRDGRVVNGRVIGKDITGEKQLQADRVASYMNYQLLFENQEWELELDRLLNLLALIGFICKKTYYDPIRKIIKSEICDHKDLIINADIKSLEDARRISHIIHLRLNDLIEGSRAGIYLEKEVDELIKRHESDQLDPLIDVIEQHTYLDLDEDSYMEPYIVTILKETGQVLRIAARFTEKDVQEKNGKVLFIDPIRIFTDYHFLVSPKGKFQSVGFGILMLHLNETINTLLNQLVDAGQLANLQGGYIDSRLKEMGSSTTLHDPGEWKRLKSMGDMRLSDGIFPINYKEPSTVLFQLLGLLITATKDLSSSTEVMTGASSADNAKTGAVSALIQQGLKVFTSIQRRIYRSLTNEYRKVFDLNNIYLDPKKYVNVLDDSLAVEQKDFDKASVNIMPVADPNLSSEAQRAQKNQILIAISQLPGANPIEVTKRLIMSAGVEDPEKLMLTAEEMQKPNPEIIKVQADIEAQAQELNIKGRELELKEKQFMLDTYRTECEILKMKADSILSIAKAESLEAGTQMQQYSQQLDVLSKKIETIMGYDQMQNDRELASQKVNNASESQSMGGSSADTSVPPSAEGA